MIINIFLPHLSKKDLKLKSLGIKNLLLKHSTVFSENKHNNTWKLATNLKL